MKILQLGCSLHDWGGIERYIVYLTEGLLERGHDVTIMCPKGSPLDQRASGKREHFDLPGKFRVDALPALIKFFRANRYDVINIHFSPDYYLPALAARICRQPCVLLTRHVVLPWSWSKRRRYDGLCHGFLAVSEAVRDKLIESGIDPGRIIVPKAGCPALVPTKPRDEVRAELGLQSDTFAVGYFGRIVPEKGIVTLGQASNLTSKVCFLAFGSGPAEGELKQFAKLDFRGRIEDVADAMNAMDAIVIPSIWDEAFPYSALEAMSLGKPIIATRSGGLPELVIDGETGSLIPKEDPAALAQAAEAMAGQPAKVTEMGARARDRQRTEYTIPKMAERVEEAYGFFREQKLQSRKLQS